MNSEESSIKKFETRVRQLILAYSDLKAEYSSLHEKLVAQNEVISQLKQQLVEANSKYDALKIARMLEISNSDMDGAKQRLTELIREVNKCINLLKEKD